jgi:predicted RNase H-like HicB family nuclease
MRYPIVIHKNLDSSYGVTAPDLPGCFSAGDTLEEAMLNATEAIECHIQGLLIDGEEIPRPQSMEVHRPNSQDCIWSIIKIDQLLKPSTIL